MTSIDHQWIAIGTCLWIVHRVAAGAARAWRMCRPDELRDLRVRVAERIHGANVRSEVWPGSADNGALALELVREHFASLVASIVCTRNLASPVGLTFTAIALVVMMGRQSRAPDPSMLFGDLSVALLTTAFSCTVVVVLVALLHALDTRMRSIASRAGETADGAARVAAQRRGDAKSGERAPGTESGDASMTPRETSR